VRSGSSCPELTDYLMSEKFGLGWKEGEVRRMRGMIAILSEINAGEIAARRKNHHG